LTGTLLASTTSFFLFKTRLGFERSLLNGFPVLLCFLSVPREERHDRKTLGWLEILKICHFFQELASYCLSHVLNSYWNRAKRTYNVQPRNWISVLMLAFSFGILLQHFEEQPNAITSTLFGIAEFPVIVRK
jgi:hypothetical protein